MSFMYSEKSTVAIGAHPIGRPGWPELAALTPSIDRKRTALMASPMSPGICLATYLTAVAEGAAWARTTREAAERLATAGAAATSEERRPEMAAARGAATAAARAGAAAAARAPRTAAHGLVMETVVCIAGTETRGRESFVREKGRRKEISEASSVRPLEGERKPKEKKKKKKLGRHSQTRGRSRDHSISFSQGLPLRKKPVFSPSGELERRSSVASE